MAATPYLPPVSLRTESNVTRILAPLHPIGCPMAQDPPCWLTFSWGMFSSCMLAITTAAKASLISKASTSWREISGNFPISFFTALAGVVGNCTGSCSASAYPRTLAIGCTPSSAPFSSDMRTRAAAPSLMVEALAAVMVPAFLSKAGLRDLRGQRRLQVSKRDRSRPTHEGPATLPSPYLILVDLAQVLQRLIRGHDFGVPPSPDLNRLDLALELALPVGPERPPERLDREVVLLLPCDGEILGALLAAVSHVHVVVRVPKPVLDHPIPDLLVAHPVLGLAAIHGEVVGHAGHRLHAPRHHTTRVPKRNALYGISYCLQSGTADLVDRCAARFCLEPRPEGGLPRGSLTQPSG
mmetsp:Transcript_5808/g.17490  ORF Transcript_5808/g.17490 Transcript_5808/m.17490 type:complete len:354 (-) Transcript_5808:229-1290(-)